MKHPHYVILLVLSLLNYGPFCARSDEQDSAFKITSKREDDQVDIHSETGKTLFTITSPFGISEAKIERSTKEWPATVVLRLKLKGLEHFEIESGEIRLAASVASGDREPRIRVWKEGKEASPLDAKSGFWLQITPMGADGKPTTEILLKEGYFEVQLSKALFEANPKSITIKWVDFYRG